MAKQEISLSPRTLETIKRVLETGHDVKLHINGKTNELMVFKLMDAKLEYREAVAPK